MIPYRTAVGRSDVPTEAGPGPRLAPRSRRTYREGVNQGSRTRRTDPVQVVTTARPSLTEDVDSRTRRYLVMMGIRTVCFVLAVAVDGWLRWVFAVGAVVLPYLAVVVANAGRRPRRDSLLPVTAPPRRALPPAAADPPPGPRHDTE
jgi:Protein of unknown function (DUF3099)